MPDDEPQPPDRSVATAWLIGATALAAWLALLWFMFGDVL